MSTDSLRCALSACRTKRSSRTMPVPRSASSGGSSRTSDAAAAVGREAHDARRRRRRASPSARRRGGWPAARSGRSRSPDDRRWREHGRGRRGRERRAGACDRPSSSACPRRSAGPAMPLSRSRMSPTAARSFPRPSGGERVRVRGFEPIEGAYPLTPPLSPTGRGSRPSVPLVRAIQSKVRTLICAGIPARPRAARSPSRGRRRCSRSSSARWRRISP